MKKTKHSLECKLLRSPDFEVPIIVKESGLEAPSSVRGEQKREHN